MPIPVYSRARWQPGSNAFINKTKQSFAKRGKLGISAFMSAERINKAMARIHNAMARIDTARLDLKSPAQSTESTRETPDTGGSARVMALVNAHEKLREEVADTLGELDTLIEELEGE